MDPGVPPLQQTCQLLALEARTFCNEKQGKKRSENQTVLSLFLMQFYYYYYYEREQDFPAVS